MIKKIFINYWELLVLVILSLTPFIWFGNKETLIGHDSSFHLDSWQYWLNTMYSWNDQRGYGYDWAVQKAFLITHLPKIIFSLFTQSAHLGKLKIVSGSWLIRKPFWTAQ